MRMIYRRIRTIYFLIPHLNHFSGPDLIFCKIHIRIRIFFKHISSHAGVIVGKKCQYVTIPFFSFIPLGIIQMKNRIRFTKSFEMSLQIPFINKITIRIRIMNSKSAYHFRIHFHCINKILKPGIRGRQSILCDKYNIGAAAF